MRARLSIIIPTLDAGDHLSATLAHLAEGLNAGLIRELILSDGGSTDGTAEVAGAELITGPAGRGGQLARGADAAKGDWLLFLHADTHLGAGWADTTLGHLRHHPDSAAYFRLAFRATGAVPRLVAGWANLRSRMLHLPYGDQGLLISRALYDEIGGYQDIPLMEDVAIARALRGSLRPLPATAATSAARYQAQGWLRRGTRNLATLIRYLSGTDPDTLVRPYNRP